MQLQLRPTVSKRPTWARVGMRGLGDSNINPTTIWTPGGGWAGTTPLPSSAPTPNLIPPPACVNDTQPGGAAFSAACQAQLQAIQQQNFQLSNAANYGFDETTCNNNWALNDAQYAALGLPRPPNTCGQNTFGLTPAGGFTSDAQTQGPQLYQDAQGNFVSVTPSMVGGGQLPAPGTGSGSGGGSAFVFSFTNLTSGDNTNFKVGDRWQVQIGGLTPGATITVTGGQNGSSATSQMGTADSSGSFTTNGQMSQAEIGTWNEIWKANGSQIAQFGFTVSPASVSSGGTASGSGTGTSSGQSVTGSFSDLLSGTTTIAGNSIPTIALVGVGLVAAILLMRK